MSTSDHRPLRTFGRIKSRPIKPRQAALVDELLPSLRPPEGPFDPRTLMDGTREAWLEIGFGGGEHLIHRALERPEVGFIGVEPFINGMTKALGAIARGGLTNIRLSGEDAVKVLDWLPDACLDRVALLYPDPWPKKRHWKRRFVGADNVSRFARVLKDGGAFHFASDIDTYVDWTLEHVRANPDFTWTATGPDDWRLPWANWPGTRYEAKARREGRVSAYLTFVRRPRG